MDPAAHRVALALEQLLIGQAHAGGVVDLTGCGFRCLLRRAGTGVQALGSQPGRAGAPGMRLNCAHSTTAQAGCAAAKASSSALASCAMSSTGSLALGGIAAQEVQQGGELARHARWRAEDGDAVG